MPKARSLKRQTRTRRTRRVIGVCCEGRVTERQYLRDLAARHDVATVKFIRDGKDPGKLVDDAVRARDDHYDEVWCVFDVDGRDVWDDVERAIAGGVNVALSNPCFELWALLHFQDGSAPTDQNRLRVKLRKHQPRYDKALDVDLMAKGHEDACRRGEALQQSANEESALLGEPRRRWKNPTTGVYVLARVLRPKDP